MSGAQVLVALDFDGDLDPQPVLARLGDALIDHEAGWSPHWRTGEPVRTHRFTFDPKRCRNTEAHGAGFRAGFVSHVEQAPTEPCVLCGRRRLSGVLLCRCMPEPQPSLDELDGAGA